MLEGVGEPVPGQGRRPELEADLGFHQGGAAELHGEQGRERQAGHGVQVPGVSEGWCVPRGCEDDRGEGHSGADRGDGEEGDAAGRARGAAGVGARAAEGGVLRELRGLVSGRDIYVWYKDEGINFNL